MTPRPASPPPDSGWSSIRPFTPRLLLKTYEITSVSATFTISTSLDTTFLKHASSSIPSPDDPTGADFDPSDISEQAMKLGIADILGKGLRVKVNGAPWEKVILHSEDVEDDAVITLYGLLPSSQYDIELGVVSGEDVIQGTIITASHEIEAPGGQEEPEVEQIVTPLPILQTATPETTPPSTPRLPPSPPPPRLITVEERAAQLRRTLASSNEQRDALASQLKFARKEAQRTDASLRSEVEALKRTAEKSSSAEQRSRQKVLALQEAVKRLHTNAVDAEAEAVTIEASLPGLDKKQDLVREEHERVREEAERSELETQEAIKTDRKRSMDLEGEIVTLNNRIDKLNTKRDKFNKEVLPELEERLSNLTKEIESIENGSAADLDFNHEAHYPHHYQTPYAPSSSLYNQRAGSSGHLPRAPPIQRPNQNQPFGPHTSPPGETSSQTARPTGMARLTAQSQANAPILPKNPSMPAHPPPRGLFMNFPRPAQQSQTIGIEPSPTPLVGQARNAIEMTEPVPAPAGSERLRVELTEEPPVDVV